MSFATKSVILSGQLNKDITYYPSPSSEFYNQLTKLAVCNVSFENSTPFDEICVISSNFVTSQQQQQGNIILYDQPLCTFRFKTSSSSNKGFVPGQIIFYPINSRSDRLIFKVKNLQGQNLNLPNGKVSFQVLFT